MPIPFSASGRLTLLFSPAGKIRRMRLPVNLVTPITTPVSFVVFNPVGGTVLASAAAQNLWSKMQYNFSTATLAPSYLVEQNFNGLFSPLETGALTGVGTGTGANVAQNVATWSFRDIVGHKLKFLIPEGVQFILVHAAFGAMSGGNTAFVNNFLSVVNPSDIGNWARSRGGNQVKTFSFLTASFNKRYRRQAGLV